MKIRDRIKALGGCTLVAAVLIFSSSANAVLIDTAGDSGSLAGSVGGTALLFGIPGHTDIQGIGNSKTFLTVNQTGGSGPEQGYNTDGTEEFETIASGTESLLLSEIPLVSIGGINYREFGFALNQTGGADQISINEITIMQGSAGNLTGYNNIGGPNIGGSTSLVFDWTSNGETLTVEDFVPGLSNIEMLMLVEADSFGVGDYVMLYMNAGDPLAANDGNDKWIVVENSVCLKLGDPLCEPPSLVPEPSVLLLLSAGLLGLGFARRRIRN
jgi:hypothetical protein